MLEVLVVMILLALIAGSLVMGSGQLASARLKRTATMVTGAVRVAFTRATATSKPQRLVFDMQEQKIWLEEGDAPMLVTDKDKTGTGGADAVTVAEQQAVAEGAGILQGPRPPRPRFHAVESMGFASQSGAKGPHPLERGITFREVQSMHDDKPRNAGRAYLYFWPGGQTERSSIQLRIGASEEDRYTLTLLVAPLTGKVTIKPGAVALTVPTDDTSASDRQDRGGF